jgi:hypothetical protein
MPTGNRAAEIFNACGAECPKTIDRQTIAVLAMAASQGASATNPNRPGAGSGR